MPTWAATTSSAATPTAPASEPSPNSRPSATRSPSNPSPPDGGFSFQDEVGGSSPPRPTIRPPTSGNAAQPLGLSRFQLISNQSTGGGAFEQPHGSLTSGFVGHWARFPDAGLVAQRSYSALLAC